LSTLLIASWSVASSVICRWPRPQGGVKARSCCSAGASRWSKPAAWGAAGVGEGITNTRSGQSSSPPTAGALHRRSNSYPWAITTASATSLVLTMGCNSPAWACATPWLIQPSICCAVVPVNGSGDREYCWCPPSGARVSNALILQSPTNSNPIRFNPASLRSMIGPYNPSSARSPDTTAVAKGIPNGATEPVMSLIGGREGSSLL